MVDSSGDFSDLAGSADLGYLMATGVERIRQAIDEHVPEAMMLEIV